MQDLQLVYKVRGAAPYVSEPEFRRLEGERDWEEVIAVVKRAFQSYRDMELEVLHKVCSDISGLRRGLMNRKGC